MVIIEIIFMKANQFDPRNMTKLLKNYKKGMYQNHSMEQGLCLHWLSGGDKFTKAYWRATNCCDAWVEFERTFLDEFMLDNVLR